MSYKIEKPEGAPSWYKSGIKCKVWNGTPTVTSERIIIWFKDGYFIDSFYTRWDHASPIESWEPVEGEWVAAWNDGLNSIVIGQYEEYKKCLNYPYKIEGCWFDHIARITDGLDLRCTPEELKERTEWK